MLVAEIAMRTSSEIIGGKHLVNGSLCNVLAVYQSSMPLLQWGANAGKELPKRNCIPRPRSRLGRSCDSPGQYTVNSTESDTPLKHSAMLAAT